MDPIASEANGSAACCGLEGDEPHLMGGSLHYHASARVFAPRHGASLQHVFDLQHGAPPYDVDPQTEGHLENGDKGLWDLLGLLDLADLEDLLGLVDLAAG
jgi:hypothetical protein